VLAFLYVVFPMLAEACSLYAELGAWPGRGSVAGAVVVVTWVCAFNMETGAAGFPVEFTTLDPRQHVLLNIFPVNLDMLAQLHCSFAA